MITTIEELRKVTAFNQTRPHAGDIARKQFAEDRDRLARQARDTDRDELARIQANAIMSRIKAEAETADEQAIRCKATVAAALMDAADAMPDQLHIDIEAVQWAYYRLYSLRVAVESIESAMMMDRLNLMLAAA